MSLNKICIMGRMTADPELKNTPSGTSVVSFTIAVDRDFKDKQTGEKQTDFIDVTAWRGTAEFIHRFFGKGRVMVVDGRLQMRKWTDKDGNKRTSAEVVAENVYFGDAKSGGASESAPADLPWNKHVEDDDDGIPF
jgi:single-strand DNA-binding protein